LCRRRVHAESYLWYSFNANFSLDCRVSFENQRELREKTVKTDVVEELVGDNKNSFLGNSALVDLADCRGEDDLLSIVEETTGLAAISDVELIIVRKHD